MSSGFCYNFPALRGIQAGKEYYVAMCPLKLIPKIFLFDEEEIPSEHRAQRILNKARIPEITNYILENPKDYIFSSLTISVDGEMKFHPYTNQGHFGNIGVLSISLDAKFLINDGQHRRAAIEEALKVCPELGDESISVVFYYDIGLKKSQQMFADLNRHAVNTTASLGILYDHRDQLAILTREIVDCIPLLRIYTDKERVSLAKHSPKLFALNHLFNANCRLLNKRKGEFISEQEKKFVKDFWLLLTETITEWKDVLEKRLSPSEVRANFIIGHGLFLEAIGLVGCYLYQTYPDNWRFFIKKLSTVDWNRSNTKDWMGRAFGSTGRINKNNQTIHLTANMIKLKLNLPLTQQDLEFEEMMEERI
ncbi:MAG: DNA sulfur modification protein DndB [Bacillota bacterium]